MLKLFISSFVLFGMTLFSGELIVNQSFLPANPQKSEAIGWKVVKQSVKPNSVPCVFSDDMAKLKLVQGEKSIILIQNPPLNEGSTYIISFEAKRNMPLKLHCFWEWIYANGKWGNSNAVDMNIGKEWKKYSFRFTPSAGKQKYKARPYLGISLREPGECFLRKVSVKPASEQLIFNQEFNASNTEKTSAEGWSVKPIGIKPGRKACIFEENMAKLSLNQNEKSILLLQKNIHFIQGEAYSITFEVRGTDQTDVRCYLEWFFADGKWGKTADAAVKCSNKWQTGTVTLLMPGPGAKFRASPYLVFILNKPGSCDIRNVKIIPKGKKAQQITDGGFDDPVSNPWKLEKKTTIEKTGGRKSPGVLSLNGPGAQASLELQLKAGRNYKISYYVRGMENKKSSNGFSEYKALMRLNPGNQLFGNEVQDCFQNHWQSREKNIFVPKGPDRILTIMLSSLSDGKLQFDDFSLTEATPEKKRVFNVKMISPWYRNSFFSSIQEDEVKGTVSFPSQILSCDISFHGQKQSFRNCGKPLEFRFPANNLKIDKYELVFTGKDKNDSTITEKIIIEKLPPGKNEVVIGKDRKFYYNGKPEFFVVIGNGRFPDHLWTYNFYNEADYFLKRTGISCTVPTYLDGIPAFLDECQKKGIKALCRISTAGVWLKLKDEAKFDKYWKGELKKIAAFKDHPALIGYYPYDEPLWNGFPLEKMKYTYESLKKLDPYHPVFICEAPREGPKEWKQYAQYCDVFGVDIYPVPSKVHSGISEKGLCSVGEYTKMCVETMKDHGTVYMVLQGFSWGNYKKAQRKTLRYPTYEEFRFMLYDAILHGAKMADFYMHNNYDPAFEQTMYKAMCGFNHIRDILVKGENLKFKYPASPKIKTSTFKYNGHYYVIVLNRAETAGKIDLRQTGKKLYLHNGEEVTPSGAVIDHIPPFTAQVYSTSEKLPDVPGAECIPTMEKRLPAFFRAMTNMVTNLDTKAFWIWNNDKNDLCCASRHINIREKIQKAVIKIAADDHFMFYLNGKLLQMGKYWSLYKEVDLVPYLKSSDNVLCVYATNLEGACGILADLEIRYADRTVEHILTDRTWQTSSKVPSYEWLKTGLTDGQLAREVFPYGEGPWR